MSPAIRAATLLVAMLAFLAAPVKAADTIGFISSSSRLTEGNSGTVPVAITVRRAGDGIGAVSVDWTTKPGTAVVFCAIAAGRSHTVALKTDGRVVAWGDNGSSGQSTVPIWLSGVSAIAAGDSHTVALKTDGTVVAWGSNGSVPIGLSGVSAIAAGYAHTVALKTDGTVVAWGNNYSGQTAVPIGLSGVSAIAAGNYHTVALKSDGTVIAWGNNYSGQTAVPIWLSGVSAIAAGDSHTVALKTDGTVVAWGDNSSGQTTIPVGLSGVSAIAAGYDHTVALKNDGTVVAWGDNGYGQAAVPVGLSGVVAIAAGRAHTVGLKNDGSLVAWGLNSSGQSSIQITPDYLNASGTLNWADGDTADKTVTIQIRSDTVVESDETFSVFLSNPTGATLLTSTHIITIINDEPLLGFTASDTRITEGNSGAVPVTITVRRTVSFTGAVGVDWKTWPELRPQTTALPFSTTEISAISAGGYHTVALKIDGTVVAWGDVGASIVPVDLSGVRVIAAGYGHSVALKTDGTVVAWGRSTVPSGLNGVSAISAGDSHTVALKTDGTVVAWGWNGSGQTSVPIGLSGVSAITAGGFHTVALKNDGTVVAWGSNLSGQITVPNGLSGVSAIAAGGSHTVALKTDGTVVAWGLNDSGQTTVPVGLTGVSAIAAGGSHTAALKTDGTVVAWGLNDSGQTTVPIGLSGVCAIAAGGFHSVALKTDGTLVAWGSNSNGQRTTQSTPDYLSTTGTMTWGDGDTADKALTVLIQGDTEIESDESFSIVLSNPIGGASLLISAHTVTIANDDQAAPTITEILAQSINEDTATAALAFTIGDRDTSVGSLALSVTSSNSTLVPAGGLVLGGSGANRTLTVTPAADQSGTSTITVTVSDGALTASSSFLLTVKAVSRRRTIEAQVPAGFQWHAVTPSDAQVDAPSGGVQSIRVHPQQTATIELAPVSPG